MLKHLGHQRLAFLDQIRALAVLLVVLCHFRGDLFPGGGVGVGVFFSLSGYLIASILFETMPLDFRAVLAFIVRRFMRVYPAYLIVIMAVVGMTALKNPAAVPAMAGALPGLLTFLWEPSWEGYSFGILWTLQVEMAFYLLVPARHVAAGACAGRARRFRDPFAVWHGPASSPVGWHGAGSVGSRSGIGHALGGFEP
jgi:peptidoglycan/LPS O-acetylase OafA/YrhL